ncbi:hypothetical protein AGABI2DRAFT_192302 [Agaricus bisporus var. bisporus H97]|uniref:hypothetical protein n=1 Tax=Agaricus bisporus var. bisporus (strain H97 / ATCC MYA-4626 / FGSC 10389) TaxID=936046 RepID=UPI00029F8004|nr:hypothetical protein AGABI2DRAFT_192302 [Agaricus bisporus var. bisporus H97]EKV47026.1 hypothetical protein AGABI2DRAFT_192302 [Agaricus bisporus var. bisporus H97]
MIIDPIINQPDSFPSYLSDQGGARYIKHGELANETLPNFEEHPPPYTEIDLERGIVIEGLETPLSGHTTQFCRFHSSYYHSEGDSNAEDCSSGIHKIAEGTKDIYTSIISVTSMSLLTLGACVEGIGKIIHGMGIIIKQHQHRAIHSLQDN